MGSGTGSSAGVMKKNIGGEGRIKRIDTTNLFRKLTRWSGFWHWVEHWSYEEKMAGGKNE